MTEPAPTPLRRSAPEARDGLHAGPAAVLYDGELAGDGEEWQATERLFIAGARVVDLFFELGAPERAAATLIPPRFEWYAEMNPLERAGWFQETTEERAGDRATHRVLTHELGELEHAATFPEGCFLYRQHIPLRVNARLLRLVFRGWVGQQGRAKILALPQR